MHGILLMKNLHISAITLQKKKEVFDYDLVLPRIAIAVAYHTYSPM